MTINNIEIGDNIRKMRKASGLNQPELAMKMNVSKQTISAWETGRNLPRMGKIEELCRILNCKKTDIVGSDDVQNTEHLGGYYVNNDTDSYVDFIRNHHDYKPLFDLCKNVTPDKVEQIMRIIETFIDKE